LYQFEGRDRQANQSANQRRNRSQDKFISILDIADKSPDAWKTVLCASSGLKANVFLKHLMVLADVGGEPLKRLHTEFARIFPDGSMTFVWQGKTFKYQVNGTTIYRD
jgi:hypothetical protein